jgi:hypothetical protein
MEWIKQVQKKDAGETGDTTYGLFRLINDGG